MAMQPGIWHERDMHGTRSHKHSHTHTDLLRPWSSMKGALVDGVSIPPPAVRAREALASVGDAAPPGLTDIGLMDVNDGDIDGEA
jgi:hypothetical protein